MIVKIKNNLFFKYEKRELNFFQKKRLDELIIDLYSADLQKIK